MDHIGAIQEPVLFHLRGEEGYLYRLLSVIGYSQMGVNFLTLLADVQVGKRVLGSDQSLRCWSVRLDQCTSK